MIELRFLTSYTKRVCVFCVQLPASAVNVTLLACAAERRAAAPSSAAAVGRQAAATIDRYLLLARHSAVNPPHAAVAVE